MLDVIFDQKHQRFIYGTGIFGPIAAENRSLEDIHHSLLDHTISGSETIYTIAMEIGKRKINLICIKEDCYTE